MKNVKENQLKQCICMPLEDYKSLINNITGGLQYVHVSFGVIHYYDTDEALESGSIWTKDMEKALANHFDVAYVSVFYSEEEELICIWYKEKEPLCTVVDIENKVFEDYRNDAVEFSALFCDFNVKLTERELLETYFEIIHQINGDYVIRLDNFTYDKTDENITVTGHEAEKLIPEGMYENIYEGNYKDFLESFNGKELATGFFRFMEVEENEEGIISGEPLDFIW